MLDEYYALSEEQIAFYQEHRFIKLKDVLDAETLSYFNGMITAKVNELFSQRQVFALTTSPENRSYVKMIVERIFPTLPVISTLEIARGVDVKIIGAVAE